MTKKAYLYLFGIIILALIPIITNKKFKSDMSQLDNNGKKTHCIITEVRHRPSKGTYHVFYWFYANYKKYKSVDMTYNETIKPGDKFEVEYLPTNPKINRINYDKPVETEPKKFTVDSLRKKVLQESKLKKLESFSDSIQKSEK